MIGNYYKLYVTTKEAIKEARADARAGRKEIARGSLRFIRNGSVIAILSACDFPPGLAVDVPLLKWEISQLENEIHPEAVSDETSDLKAIRASLDLIAHYVSTKPNV